MFHDVWWFRFFLKYKWQEVINHFNCCWKWKVLGICLCPHDQGLYKEKVCTHCKQKPGSKGWHYYHRTLIILAHSWKNKFIEV
jgi:hypothetical protein